MYRSFTINAQFLINNGGNLFFYPNIFLEKVQLMSNSILCRITNRVEDSTAGLTLTCYATHESRTEYDSLDRGGN